MPGLEKTSFPAGRPDIEGGFGGPDSAGEAGKTAGTPMKCFPTVSSRAGNATSSTQAKKKHKAGLSGAISPTARY